ncbi:MAG TPA: signal peptidase I [Candidatus Limnocylindria bacterium]|nr:signal peptidase I [Candidatus Limnocylindria bacterium]
MKPLRLLALLQVALLLAAAPALAAGITVHSGGLALVERQYGAPLTCTLVPAADTYVRGDQTGTSFGGATSLLVGNSSASTRRSLLHFDLAGCFPAIPPDAIIHTATVRLTSASLLNVGPRTYGLRRATAGWTESTTWFSQPSVQGTLSARATIGLTTVVGTPIDWPVGPDVQAFVSSRTTDFGWQLADTRRASRRVALGKHQLRVARGRLRPTPADRRLRSMITLPRLLFVLALALWVVAFRPASLGGPAGYVVVAGESMQPTLTNGTLVLTMTSAVYATGDVIAFRVVNASGSAPLVIHRIVGGSAEAGFRTRGDNMPLADPWLVRPEQILGRQAAALAEGGPLVALLRAPIVLASLAAGLATYLVLGWRPRRSADPQAVAQAPA